MADDLRNVIFDTYRLTNTDDPVILTVTIGFAQDGSTVVKIGDEVIGESDTSFSIEIGKNSALHGKELRVLSLVQDIRDDCSIVSSHIVLSGGRRIKDWTLLEEPTEDLETYPLNLTLGLFR